MKKLIAYNKYLFLGFIISVIAIILYFVSYNIPEWWPGAGILFEFIYQMSIAYGMSYLFFILQVYVPSVKNEEKAFSAIKKDLQSLAMCLIYIKYIAENYFEFEENFVNIDDSERLLFTYVSPQNRTGNEVVYGIDISVKSFSSKKQYIEKKIQHITTNSLYIYSSDTIIELIGNLHSNTLLDGLIMACHGREAGSNQTVQNRKKEYENFIKTAEGIWLLSCGKPLNIYPLETISTHQSGIYLYDPL